MADLLGNPVASATGESVAPIDEDEIDLVLDAAQQAWERGETLLMWVDRYPTYASELGELALSLERQRLAPELSAEESAAAGRSFLHAIGTVLEPAKQLDESGE